MTTLRQGLLDGRGVALAGGVPPTIGGALAALGARVEGLDAVLGQGPDPDEDGASAWLQSGAPLHALVYQAAPAFGSGGQDGLRDCMERAWVAVRTVAVAALIPAGAGKVVLIGPRVDAGPFAAAARAALENLARTLSVEWARYGVGAVAIAPGVATTEDALAELVCFLVSPAGEYFTGCAFELGRVR